MDSRVRMGEAQAGKKTFSLRKSIPRVIGALFLIFMAAFFYNGYFRGLDNQQTILYASDELLAGSPMSFRILLLTRQEGAPIAGASVKLELQRENCREKTLLFKSRTDRNGSVEPSIIVPELAEGRYNLIINTKSRKGVDRVVRPVMVTRTYRMLLSTDKPVYQPGQVIHMRMLAVDKGKMKTAAGASALFEVLDPRGNKVFKKSIPLGAYGVASADFTLAHEILLGAYHIKTTVGNDSAERVVEVKRYVLPKFKVAFNPSRRTYLPSETVTGTVSGEYFFGKKVKNSRVTIDLSTFDVAFHRIARVEGRTDEEGVYNFSLDLPAYFVGQPLDKGRGMLKFDVAIIDGAGHEEHVTDTLTVAESLEESPVASESNPARKGRIPITIDCIPERENLLKDVENRIFVVTTLPGGTPLSCEVTLRIAGDLAKSRSDEFGVAEFAFTPRLGIVEIELTAGKGSEYYGSSKLQLSPDIRREDLMLRTNRSLYRAGDELSLTVLSPDPQGTVYVDVLRDKQTLLTRSLDLIAGRGGLVCDLTDDMVGTLRINAYRITRGAETVRDTRTIAVRNARDLVVKVDADRDVYRPGEKSTLNFQVKDSTGKPVAAALGLSIVDESVFALAEKHPGLEKVYLALEKELMEPRIEVCSHNSSLDMKQIAAQNSYTPEAQRAAAVILAALRDLAGNTFINSMPEKMDRRENEMSKSRSVGFTMLVAFLMACLLWITLRVSDCTLREHQSEEAPLLNALHYACLFVLSLMLSLSMCPEAFRYGDFAVLIVLFIFCILLLLPCLQACAYLYRYSGWEALSQFLLIVVLSNISVIYFLGSTRIISGYAPPPVYFAVIILGTGIVSIFARSLITLRTHSGSRGLIWGFFLILPLFLSVMSLKDSHSGMAAIYLILYLVVSLVIHSVTSPGRSYSFTCAELLLVLLIVALLAAVIAPNFLRARCQGQSTACKSNLKNIATALEMFSTDHGGRYPALLSELTPKYVKSIPTCPSAGKDTYSSSYRVRRDPDYFQICCSGTNHADVGLASNQPAYDSVQGLIESGCGDAAPPAGTGAESSPGSPKAPSTIAGIRVRQFFPETLYWNPLVITDSSGKASVEVPMADSITTWRLTGTAHTERGVMGTFAKPIRVFQDFFIDPDLPEHLTRGDMITLPVALYNYLPRKQELAVSLIKDDWFEVPGAMEKQITMNPHEVTSVSFTIRAREVGDHQFTVCARSHSQKDAVSRTIRVDPDGRETLFVQNGTLASDLHCTISVPAESVPGGNTIVVKIYPGVSTQILDGLDGMLKMPYG